MMSRAPKALLAATMVLGSLVSGCSGTRERPYAVMEPPAPLETPSMQSAAIYALASDESIYGYAEQAFESDGETGVTTPSAAAARIDEPSPEDQIPADVLLEDAGAPTAPLDENSALYDYHEPGGYDPYAFAYPAFDDGVDWSYWYSGGYYPWWVYDPLVYYPYYGPTWAYSVHVHHYDWWWRDWWWHRPWYPVYYGPYWPPSGGGDALRKTYNIVKPRESRPASAFRNPSPAVGGSFSGSAVYGSRNWSTGSNRYPSLDLNSRRFDRTRSPLSGRSDSPTRNSRSSFDAGVSVGGPALSAPRFNGGAAVRSMPRMSSPSRTPGSSGRMSSPRR